MHLALSILSAGVIVSSLRSNKPEFGPRVGAVIGGIFNERKTAQVTDNHDNPIELNEPERDPKRTILTGGNVDDVIDDVDFDGDEFDDDEYFKGLLGAGSVDSLMHVHRREGEILVPCFGMWWPVGGYGGGGGGGYEYIDDYGDYRKKKRRSRKQRKAAKTRKKS